MSRKSWIVLLIIIFVLGGISGLVFNRFIVPWLAGLPGLSGLHKLESSNPVVINRREEVVFNEGADYQNLSRQASAYTVSIYTSAAGNYKFLGNGIIVSADGMIIAPHGILGKDNSFRVVTNDGTAYDGLLRALDPKSELAVITIGANNLPFAQFANASDLVSSQRLIYVGRSNKEFIHEFALGLVTSPVANLASLTRVYNSELFENTIATDAKINADFAGGPIINLDGKVVGMTATNLSVLPGEALTTGVASYLSGGKIARSEFGIKYLLFSQGLANIKNMPQGGVLVVSVDEASPAKLAGILPNDLIVTADNQPLPQTNFEQILNQRGPGDMPVELLRNGQKITLTVKLVAK